MASKPVQLENRTFASKKEATAHYADILTRNLNRGPLAGQDLEDAVALLARHPRLAEKLSRGATAISVRPSSDGGRCFYIERPDGTAEDFSIGKCLDGKDADPVAMACKAFRRAVQDLVHGHKATYFDRHADPLTGKAPCQLTGKPLAFDEANADHYEPYFQEISERFLAESGLDPAKIPLKSAAGGGRELADGAVAAAFRVFHERVAKLRVIDAKENLAVSFRARRDRRGAQPAAAPLPPPPPPPAS